MPATNSTYPICGLKCKSFAQTLLRGLRPPNFFKQIKRVRNYLISLLQGRQVTEVFNRTSGKLQNVSCKFFWAAKLNRLDFLNKKIQDLKELTLHPVKEIEKPFLKPDSGNQYRTKSQYNALTSRGCLKLRRESFFAFSDRHR